MRVDHIQVTLTPQNINVINLALHDRKKTGGADVGLNELLGVFDTLQAAAFEKTVY